MSILAVAVCAVLAGACTFAAVTDWIRHQEAKDAHQARTGNGPAIFATLRNTLIGYHRTNGATNIAAATRRANHRPHDLIDAVTRSNPTTQ